MFWVLDPRPIVLELSESEGIDLLCQFAPRWDGQGQCNTGFVYVSNRRKHTWFVKHLFQSLSFAAPLIHITEMDQYIWNTLIRHWRYGQLNHRILPFKHFSRVNENEPVTNETIVAHVVAGESKEKMENLKRFGFWKLSQ